MKSKDGVLTMIISAIIYILINAYVYSINFTAGYIMSFGLFIVLLILLIMLLKKKTNKYYLKNRKKMIWSIIILNLADILSTYNFMIKGSVRDELSAVMQFIINLIGLEIGLSIAFVLFTFITITALKKVNSEWSKIGWFGFCIIKVLVVISNLL